MIRTPISRLHTCPVGGSRSCLEVILTRRDVTAMATEHGQVGEWTTGHLFLYLVTHPVRRWTQPKEVGRRSDQISWSSGWARASRENPIFRPYPARKFGPKDLYGTSIAACWVVEPEGVAQPLGQTCGWLPCQRSPYSIQTAPFFPWQV